jgi:hypothetical protein
MNDYLMRIFTKEGDIRSLACITTNLVDEARRRHGTFPTASAGRGSSAAGRRDHAHGRMIRAGLWGGECAESFIEVMALNP